MNMPKAAWGYVGAYFPENHIAANKTIENNNGRGLRKTKKNRQESFILLKENDNKNNDDTSDKIIFSGTISL